MRVARWAGSLVAWERDYAAFKARLAPVFGRRELRETAGAFLDGLLSGIERKTGWLMAEQAGLDHPNRMQTLIGRSQWEADALRDRVRADVLEALGDPDGVLVIDETGFLKKGTHSVGVARQYSGTGGRIEPCQIGVFLTYASRFGQALIDRRLYLPEAWTGDAARRAKASVPADIASRPSPPSRASSSPRRSTRARHALSSWPTRFTARTRNCGTCWRLAGKPTCSPYAPTTISGFWKTGG